MSETTANAAKGLTFTLSHTVDAPREQVFKAWTETEQLSKWWGPKGFALTVHHLDLCPGGSFHYSMRSADGYEMWGKFIYQEIAAPERLVFINSFADKAGNVIRAPFSDTWPLELHNTYTFIEQDGKTTLTLQSYPLNATEEEHRTFEAGFESMRLGFGGTFEKLTEYLAQA